MKLPEVLVIGISRNSIHLRLGNACWYLVLNDLDLADIAGVVPLGEQDINRKFKSVVYTNNRRLPSIRGMSSLRRVLLS